MEKRINNLFSFAKKELSQDAVICWLLNWVNHPESELCNLAIDLFKLLGVQDFDSNQKVTIKTQIGNADIVVALHKQRVLLIIEDKTYSSEHDNQIEKYKRLFSQSAAQKLYGINEDEPFTDIRTVYFKTGFFYDEDKLVQADTKVEGQRFLNTISKKEYRNKSEILDSYVAFLKQNLEWYDTYGDFTGRYSNGVFFVSWEYIAQHNLMRTFFPEALWDGKGKAFKVSNGSSSGRPWTELNICEEKTYPNTQDCYQLFWRIDTNVKGPYLSLRYYEWIEKGERSDSDKKRRHSEYYDRFLSICKEVIEETKEQTGIEWSDVKNRYAGNSMESALLTINLSDYLLNWKASGEKLAEAVRLITDYVWTKIKNS